MYPLTEAADKIRSQYKDARILLFGSHARNDARENSDIDLCIVLDNPEKRLLEISRDIRKVIYPILKKPLDILVYDSISFNDRSSFPLTMEAEILEYAQEL
ncbi:MAG: nucleotidyltransferase domain-containing protein [Spirochaetaceae bacterium]|jgi:predicted nucleotidyltransferase|nr:nucleotidyltransferase domain-containing protein [Spirochaetaceae bacterium]